MPTSTVQMPIKPTSCKSYSLFSRRFNSGSNAGFSLMEMIVVLAVLSLLTTVAMINFGGGVGKSSFKKEAMEIVNILKIAQNGAAQSNRRYAVIFDFLEQTYTLQEVRTLDELADMSLDTEERTLTATQLSNRCRIEFITFDDLLDTRDEGAIDDQLELKSYFIAGRSGWQNGGKIGLTDIDGNAYSIIVNRMSKSIIFEEGDIDTYFLEPKENLRF